MKIVKIRISNYKSYSPSGCEIPFTDITGFIGPNSAGKTNILEALDWFFHPAKLTDPSFFHKSNTDDPIHIDVTFKCPEVDSEYAVCKKLLCTENGEITLRRTYRWSENKKQAETDKDFTPTFMWEYCDSYKALESPTVKPSTAKKSAGVPEDFRTSEEYRFFVDKVGDTVSSEANFSAMVSAFILNSSYEELKQNRVIQWKPVDESKLPKGAKDFIKSLPIPEYLYLPVEYSVTDELSAKKGTRFSSIMSSLMDDINEENRTQKQKDFENLLQQIERYSEKYLDLPLQRINDILGTPSTQWNFTGASINIQRKEVDMENALKPEWKLSVDDGFCSDISTKGSGMQRIALLQMLQTYIDMCPAKQSSYRKIILAIEEPELYLHPPYRRSLYNVFRAIKDRIQVCYTTHDPIFVQMEYFDEVRLVCKKSPSESTVYYTDWSLFEGDEWKDFFKSRTSQEAKRDLLYSKCTQKQNEGFFADKVILVEGNTEGYALPIYFRKMGFDLDASNTVLIECGSVDNIKPVCRIFTAFHIPTYTIFDGDRPSEKQYTLYRDITSNLDSQKCKPVYEKFWATVDGCAKGTSNAETLRKCYNEIKSALSAEVQDSVSDLVGQDCFDKMEYEKYMLSFKKFEEYWNKEQRDYDFQRWFGYEAPCGFSDRPLIDSHFTMWSGTFETDVSEKLTRYDELHSSAKHSHGDSKPLVARMIACNAGKENFNPEFSTLFTKLIEKVKEVTVLETKKPASSTSPQKATYVIRLFSDREYIKSFEPIQVFSCAGGPLNPDMDDPISYAEGNVPEHTKYLIRINGDSMAPRIPDDAVLAIKDTADGKPRLNSVGVFCYNGNTMCKQLRKDKGDSVFLVSWNRSFDPIEVNPEELHFYGEVICEKDKNPILLNVKTDN